MYKYLLLIGLVIVLPVFSASAETVMRSGSIVTVGDDQEVAGDFYGWSNAVTLSGKMGGDVVVAGGTVTINGEVASDVLATAGTVSIHGLINDDVRVVAGEVSIASEVKGSLVVFAGRVKILPTAVIHGDIVVYGNEVVIDGDVKGDLVGTVNFLRLNGKVEGNIDVGTGSLTIGDRAEIVGNISYRSANELVRATNATISGTVTKTDVIATDSSSNYRLSAIYALMILFGSLTWYLIAKRKVLKFANGVVDIPTWKTALFGIAFLVSGPFVIGILMASVLGSVVGLIILFFYASILIFTVTLLPIVIATFLAYVSKKSFNDYFLLAVVFGALTIAVVWPLGVFGFLVLGTVYLIALGNLILSLWNLLHDKHNK